MKQSIYLLLMCVCLSCNSSNTYNEPILESSRQLIERVIPGYSSQFQLELIEAENGKDVFEITSINDKVALKGNCQMAIASALNYYLKYTCNAHVSWCGDQLNLANNLPLPSALVHKVIDAKHRVYFNYCTLNYTASWWDWERWQREIDFMAMNGINMPLSVIGLEGVWYNTLLKFGYSDEEARSYLVGSAYFAWQWMTNIQSHGGPLPKNWIDTHVALGQKIINRQLELGMQPIQQGFTGCVPRSFMQKFPEAKILQEAEWCGFEGTVQLDPLDPLFKRFGKAFLEEERKLFGAHGVYAADPFHEGHPPQETTSYLKKVGENIYSLMTELDTSAIWAMQAWSIREDIAKAAPRGKLLVLDLNGHTWRGKENFWNYDFVAGNLHNFGGRINMHGDLKLLASNQYQKAKEKAPNAVGSGLFMESIVQNPVYYDLAFEMACHEGEVDINEWLKKYAMRRYGQVSVPAQQAWQLLLEGPYKPGTNGVEKSSIICARPAVDVKKSGPNAGFHIPYAPQSLIKALGLLLQDHEKLSGAEGYRYDIVDLQRQMLSNLGQAIHRKAAEAFKANDRQAFQLHSQRFLNLLMDADKVLSTRSEYRFDHWVKAAREWGITPEEKDLYDYNASLLVTQWGADKIFDYSWREWSGLISGYYYPRWKMFYAMLDQHLKDGTQYNEEGLPQVHGREALRANDFYSKLADWETSWIETPKQFKDSPTGNELTTVLEAYKKYSALANEYYK
ncbi:MAG: alpha-N-acetylglucosaminidase [Carboxylicivirga sp.]|nr:alpha-N-acetylglucosaminidase [Carboxylicivirga sp.]